MAAATVLKNHNNLSQDYDEGIPVGGILSMVYSAALVKERNERELLYKTNDNESDSPSGGIFSMAEYMELNNQKENYHKCDRIYPLGGIESMNDASTLTKHKNLDYSSSVTTVK